MTACEVETRGERGFVLVLVIFIVALLALLAAGFSASVRSHMRLAAGAIQGARAEAAADAGVELAVLSLLAGSQPASTFGPRTRRFAIDGSPASCAADEHTSIKLRVQDTGGRVSINLSGERLLLAFFSGLGASREAASRATDLVIDYRDADSNRRPNGAEKPEYEAAGRPQGPKNGPFDTIEELNQVLGLDPSLIAAAMPYITVHSQTAGIDPRTASPELAALLARGIADLPSRPGPALANPGTLPSEFVIGSPQRVFTITSEGRLDTGAVFVREAVVELQSTRAAIPAYKMWKRGVASSPGTATPGDLPPC